MAGDLVNYNETCFYPLLGHYGGLRRLISASDFKYAIILSVLLAAMSGYFTTSRAAVQSLSPVFIALGAALVAVVIAGLAIIVSTTDDDFVRFMKGAGIYEKILFPFWLSSIISGMCIVFNITLYLIAMTDKKFGASLYGLNMSDNIIFTALLMISLASALYALFMSITIIENAIKYGLYRGEFRTNNQT